jgi:hypothetical protein
MHWHVSEDPAAVIDARSPLAKLPLRCSKLRLAVSSLQLLIAQLDFPHHLLTLLLPLVLSYFPRNLTTMALAPRFAGQKLASSSIQPKAVHTLELCKFPPSTKRTTVSPLIHTRSRPRLRLSFQREALQNSLLISSPRRASQEIRRPRRHHLPPANPALAPVLDAHSRSRVRCAQALARQVLRVLGEAV